MSTTFYGMTEQGESFRAGTRYSAGRGRTGFQCEASGGQMEAATHFEDESGQHYDHRAFHDMTMDCDERRY